MMSVGLQPRPDASPEPTHRVDADAIRATVAAIEAQPQRWLQDSYASACGATFCFAGWACHLAGLDVREMLKENSGSVFDVAQERLGLTDGQATSLFMCFTGPDGFNHPTVEEFKAFITRVCGVTFT